jgi:signal peptidase I
MATRKVVLGILAGLLCVVAITAGVSWVKGYRVYVVHTGSMLPTLPLGSIVVDKPAAGLNGLKPGDIITFRHSDLTTDVVTHRVASLDGGLIQTKGDANTSIDTWNIRPNQVEGVRIATIPKVGYLLVFLQQPAGLGATLLAFVSIFLLWALFFPSAAPIRRAATSHRASRHKPPNVAVVRGRLIADDAPTTTFSPSDLDNLSRLLA